MQQRTSKLHLTVAQLVLWQFNVRLLGIISAEIKPDKIGVYQKLVVVAGWLGVSSGAGMRRGLQVPWSDFVGLTGGGVANATLVDLLTL